MANALTFHQLATILNSIQQQATGKADITATDTASFVSIATTTLLSGYDPVMSAISQVLSKTIFSVRPYNRKLRTLYADSVRYGNHVRKLTALDKAFEEDDRSKLTDTYSIDQYVVNKPSVLQTNFYGEEVYQKSLTIFKDQLDVAFSGPDEFGRFISMIMQNASDQIEQAHESIARMTLANFIGAKISGDSTNVIHVLDVYDDETGETVTASDIHELTNYAPFVRWLYGFLETLSQRLEERTILYHKNFTGYDIPRHTPVKNQKLIMYGPELNAMKANVLSGTYNLDQLKMIDHEAITYWQAIQTPMGINVKPAYNDADGKVHANPDAVVQSNILGVLYDEEAMGYTMINEWSQSTPFNARGGYSNIYWHFTDRYWNDLTENAIVLLLDTAPTVES